MHGDDYATVGSLPDLKWLQGQLGDAFGLKTVIAEHSGRPGVVDEAKILNMVIRALSEGWEYKCDQRHAEIILEELHFVGCKPFGTPGVEEVWKRTPDEDVYGSEPLEPEIATRYRALTAQLHGPRPGRASVCS